MVEKNIEHRLIPKEELTEGLYVLCLGVIYQIALKHSTTEIYLKEVPNITTVMPNSRWVRENFTDFCYEIPETIQLNRDRKLNQILQLLQ